jgi:hypothetical protein
MVVAGECLIVGAPGKGRIYVFRSVASGWEQMKTLDRPNGFGNEMAAFGNHLFVSDAHNVITLALPDLVQQTVIPIHADTERLQCAIATGAIIASTEAVRVGTREIYRSHNEINRVRAMRDGGLAVCTSVNTVFISPDGQVQKTIPIPSLDLVEIGDVMAISRYDEETVVFVNQNGTEQTRVSLPGGSPMPTGYGQTLVAIGSEMLAVAAPYDNVNTAVETGSVFLYRINGNDVFVHDMLNTPEVVENAHFGEHMVAFGNTLLVSAERIGGNAGRISVFST